MLLAIAYGDRTRTLLTLTLRPAYDDNFTKAFGIKVFGKKTLNDISYFYKENKETVDKIKIYMIEFLTGKQTKRIYTKAKIIDMAGFVEGEKLQLIQSKILFTRIIILFVPTYITLKVVLCKPNT